MKKDKWKLFKIIKQISKFINIYIYLVWTKRFLECYLDSTLSEFIASFIYKDFFPVIFSSQQA